MPDKMTIEQRHNNMAAIKGKDTKPEILVRKFLWARGFRYRLNHPRLPGKPDIVLRKYRTCILVNGCFWHGHEGCKYCVVPKSNTQFWQDKIRRNRERDHEVLHQKCLLVWNSSRTTTVSRRQKCIIGRICQEGPMLRLKIYIFSYKKSPLIKIQPSS